MADLLRRLLFRSTNKKNKMGPKKNRSQCQNKEKPRNASNVFKKMAHVRFNHKFLHRNWCFVFFLVKNDLLMWVPGVSSVFSSTSTLGKVWSFSAFTFYRGSWFSRQTIMEWSGKKAVYQYLETKKNTYEKTDEANLESPPLHSQVV